MMEMKILRAAQKKQFMSEMQEAFQKGYESYSGSIDDESPVLPTEDIEHSLADSHAIAYQAVDNGIRLGGAIIVISGDGKKGELHFLYTKVGMQNKGVATFLWRSIEALYPDVEEWETCTPYFDVRNIHFYINKCGFHAVEFFNSHHQDPHETDEDEARDGGGMFRFVKGKA